VGFSPGAQLTGTFPHHHSRAHRSAPSTGSLILSHGLNTAAGFINRALTGKEIRELFPYFSNRLEGNAPLTIFAILELLERARLDQD
jgi:hypothetical protein